MGNRYTGRGICTVDDCDAHVHSKGYCSKHFAHWKTHGHPCIRKPKICTPCHVVGCGNVAAAGIRNGAPLCNSHASMQRKYGRLEKTKPRRHDYAAIRAAGEKRCTKCGSIKSLDGYRRLSESWCKDCYYDDRRIRRNGSVEEKLKTRIRSRVVTALKSTGTSPTIKRDLGYSIDDMRRHLERQFTKGMTWDRFMNGEIHIDHIVPVNEFNMADPIEFVACWSLPNLRPLWARDNLAKGARRVSLL